MATQPKAEIVLLPAEPVQIVRPVVSAQEAKKLWKEYIELCQEILDDSDYIWYVSWSLHQPGGFDKEQKPEAFTEKSEAEKYMERLKANPQASAIRLKPRKRRSAWDKLAKFFGLTVPAAETELAKTEISQVGEYIIERRTGRGFSLIVYQDAQTLEVKKAVATVAVSGAGRTEIGEAVCSESERRSGRDSFAHADHDIPSTAFTRAKNRAISRCIGTGEVSAEEVEASSEFENPKTEPAAPSETQPKAETPKQKTKPEKVPEKPEEKPPEKQEERFKANPEAKLAERIEALKKYVYGPVPKDNQRHNSLIYYLPFCIPTVVKAHVEKVEGRWDPDLWKAEFMKMEDRKHRIELVEQGAENMTKAEFIAWAKKAVAENFGNLKT
jgi:hypothetical protein